VSETLLHSWHHNIPEHIEDKGGIGPEFTVEPGSYRFAHDPTLKISLQALVSHQAAVVEEVHVHKRFGRDDIELREITPASADWKPLTLGTDGEFAAGEPTTVRVVIASGKGKLDLFQASP